MIEEQTLYTKELLHLSFFLAAKLQSFLHSYRNVILVLLNLEQECCQS